MRTFCDGRDCDWLNEPEKIVSSLAERKMLPRVVDLDLLDRLIVLYGITEKNKDHKDYVFKKIAEVLTPVYFYDIDKKE